MHCAQESACVLRINFRRDAMAEVEYVAAAFAVAG
jgi:hypothetical protein